MSLRLLYQNNDKKIVDNLSPDEMKAAIANSNNVLWLDIVDPGNDELDLLEKVFDLHPLTIEDCINTNARPKIEQFEHYIFIVIHAATSTPRSQRVRTIELNMCVGKNFLITIHQEPIRGVETAMERARKNPAMMWKSPDTLLHAVVDSLVDNYLPVLDMMDYKISAIETQVLKNPTQKTLNLIFAVKKDILSLRRFISPQRDAVNFLSKENFQFINPKTRVYFRDVYDNLIFINDTIDTYRDITNSALDAYLSTISNKTNDTMKILTIIATIMMPLTLITGVYGMNFRQMPMLTWQWGFYVVSFIMILLGLGMLVFFKRKEWI